jgi:hypothetical protein
MAWGEGRGKKKAFVLPAGKVMFAQIPAHKQLCGKRFAAYKKLMSDVLL